MTKEDNIYPQQHRAFLSYLTEKFDGDSHEAQPIVETAERIIPNTLHDYFDMSIASIYELQDTDEIERLRREIKVKPVLRDLDNSVEPRYTEVLKWYRLFVKWSQGNAAPLPVSGEYSVDTGKEGSEVADEAPLVESTVYLEGAAAEAQPEEIRRRNMLLRQACIDYFRRLHGGRIVCECCGFDFTKAYAISDEYIEVHHRFPFSQTEGEHPVNSQTDLVPLCANCHRMIHHGQGGRGNCMSLEELKRIYKGIVYE